MEDDKELSRNLLLKNKSEISEQELAEIIDLHHEYADISLLKKYTEKKYRDLSENEKNELIEKLLTDEPYIKYKNCYIAESKLLYDQSETLIKETDALSRLSDLGYEVYLLPYAYARDEMNCFQKSADSIALGEFLEMKTVVSVGKSAGYNAYKDAHLQSDNMYLSFVNETDEKKIINNIYRAIGGIRNGDSKNDFSRHIFLNFEKTNITSFYKVSKEGYVSKIETFGNKDLKKYKEAMHGSQVEVDPLTEQGGRPIFNISQSDEKSITEKSSEAKLLYERTAVDVDGLERECEHGVLEGFKNAVRMVDRLKDENLHLKKENSELKKNLERKARPGNHQEKEIER